MPLNLVLNMKSVASSDNAGNYVQHVTGTSVSVNGNPDTSVSIDATINSSVLIFPTDFADQITISG